MASKLFLGETHSELVRKFNELVDEFKSYLPLSGGTLTGDIKFNTVTTEDIKKIGTANSLAHIDFEGKTGSLSLNASGLVGINAESVEICGDSKCVHAFHINI